jgi:hypothetical protein
VDEEEVFLIADVYAVDQVGVRVSAVGAKVWPSNEGLKVGRLVGWEKGWQVGCEDGWEVG